MLLMLSFHVSSIESITGGLLPNFAQSFALLPSLTPSRALLKDEQSCQGPDGRGLRKPGRSGKWGIGCPWCEGIAIPSAGRVWDKMSCDHSLRCPIPTDQACACPPWWWVDPDCRLFTYFPPGTLAAGHSCCSWIKAKTLGPTEVTRAAGRAG